MDKDQIQESIVNGLSQLIRVHLLNAAYQQYTPDSDPDKSDSTIADGQEKAKKLRQMREDFENITTGIVAPF